MTMKKGDGSLEILRGMSTKEIRVLFDGLVKDGVLEKFGQNIYQTQLVNGSVDVIQLSQFENTNGTAYHSVEQFKCPAGHKVNRIQASAAKTPWTNCPKHPQQKGATQQGEPIMGQLLLKAKGKKKQKV